MKKNTDKDRLVSHLMKGAVLVVENGPSPKKCHLKGIGTVEWKDVFTLGSYGMLSDGVQVGDTTEYRIREEFLSNEDHY